MPWRSSIFDCRYSGNESQNLLTSTCAIIASVAIPPSIGRSGAGATTPAPPHPSSPIPSASPTDPWQPRPAAIARTADDAHAQLRGHDVELLAALFVDHVQHTAAAGAVARLDVDQHLIPRQMRGQRAVVAVGAGLAPRPRLVCGRLRRVLPGLAFPNRPPQILP